MKLRLLRKMGLFRKRDKRKDAEKRDVAGDFPHPSFGGGGGGQSHFGRQLSRPPASGAPAAGLLQIPDTVLERIFAFVCPHTQDETYEKCEDSSVEDACMLCDLRDLARCVKVCRRWRRPAARVL